MAIRHSDFKPIHQMITSTSNPRIRALMKLEDGRFRRKSGLFPVEGKREVQLALAAGYLADTFYFCPHIFPDFHYDGKPVIPVSAEVYEKIAYRGGTEGIIGVFQQEERELPVPDEMPDGIIIVLESVEKPGNLGAILRTADAGGVNAVIVLDAITDIYNPNIIRSSVGAFFTVPVFSLSRERFSDWLTSSGYHLWVLSPEAPHGIFEQASQSKVALLFGTESTGVSDFWKHHASSVLVSLPMRGKIDSLNVSNSVAISVFEVLRKQGKY